MPGAEDVLALDAPTSHPTELDVGVVGLHPSGGEVDIEVRAFFSNDRGNVLEDSVTGSLNASVAQWLVGAGLIDAPYVAGQGRRVGADGRVYVSRDDDGTIWIPGNTSTLVEGTLRL